MEHRFKETRKFNMVWFRLLDKLNVNVNTVEGVLRLLLSVGLIPLLTMYETLIVR